jgi:predicted GH43/DUF377 family glycosyl hydrolase
MEKKSLKQKKVNWRKIGHIFCPDKNYDWMQSHASYPWAENISDDLFKIYFSARDKNNKSSIGYIIVNIQQPSKVLEISSIPVLSAGEIGTFDDSGVSLSCIVQVGEKKMLYYLGWNILVSVPWKNTIGVAVYNTAIKSFEKYSKAPVVGIHHVDPFTLTYPFVLFDDGVYKMWYGSSLFWGPKVEDTLHVIKYATSSDGIAWHRDGTICIRPKDKIEYAIVKPFVLKENGLYKMWYSYRETRSYQIGYAESINGIDWVRKDNEVGIQPSLIGWDDEMVCYPYLFDHRNSRYMIYNGNGYGKSGFGLAVLEN